MGRKKLSPALALSCCVVASACAGSDVESEADAVPGDQPYDDDAILEVLDLPGSPYPYEPELPLHFRTNRVVNMINTPADDPITDEGATLGRVLFYDTALSANRTVACASCHRSEAAFSDPAASSIGFDGEETGRNAMSLVNVRYYARGSMFWDERAGTVEEQVLMPIQSTKEMGMTLDGVIGRLEATSYYPKLFALAFGDPEITEERLSFALAQFVRAHVSANSRYDEGLAAVAGQVAAEFPNFTAEENRGKQLFFAPPPQGGSGCAACHVANPPPGAPGAEHNVAIFLMPGPRNNGLTADSESDQGIGGVTGLAQDMGLFKSPSLRNVALTAPYMHDGSIATLRGVIEHYNDGVQPHPNLDPILRDGPDGPPRQLGLSQADIDALVAFLETLTDTDFITDERFSNPWRE